MNPPAGAVAEIVLVTAVACHLCDDAHAVLERLAAEYPLGVREVDLESAEGMTLIARHRPTMSPLVLVDGEFFSAGRLPRGKLRKRLARLSDSRPVGAP